VAFDLPQETALTDTAANTTTDPQATGAPTAAAAPISDPSQLKSFAEFYPFYLAEHSNRTCRRLHFVGSTLSLLCVAMLIATGKPQYLLYGLLCGYGFAWVGHFGFEKNKPASFKRPMWSFMGD
jgi:hypothetical protein